MRYGLLGALFVVGGIAALIEASRHRSRTLNSQFLLSAHTGWAATTYDLVRIGGWALVIFGAVIVAFALVREARR
jgi:hypothetical protein